MKKIVLKKRWPHPHPSPQPEPPQSIPEDIIKIKRQIERDLIKKAKLEQAAKQEIDPKEIKLLSAQWQSHAKRVSTQITNLVIKAFAFSDGINRASDTLKYGLKIPDAIDVGYINKVIAKIFAIELAGLFVSQIACKEEQKDQLVSRLIDLEFPGFNAVDINSAPPPTPALPAPVRNPRLSSKSLFRKPLNGPS